MKELPIIWYSVKFNGKFKPFRNAATCISHNIY